MELIPALTGHVIIMAKHVISEYCLIWRYNQCLNNREPIIYIQIE